MLSERTVGGTFASPFPVYPRLSEVLAAAHLVAGPERDATVAHVLGTCAGYAYADIDTFALIMTRLGLERHACVRITQTVESMFIFSTAYLAQSQCGRVVVLCYRGTEVGTLANWLGDAEVGSGAMSLGGGAENFRVHSGFHRNVRATWWAVIRELAVAVEGRSLAGDTKLDHPLEALYVTGHSLGGAMAVLFALTLFGGSVQRSLAERLRAVYTFGQPMAVAEPLPGVTGQIEGTLFRHVMPRDPIPALPPTRWGPFAHFGQEYQYTNGQWQRAECPTGQLNSVREIPPSVVAFFASEKRRASFRYTLSEHGPHRYIEALRPNNRVTEFGD